MGLLYLLLINQCHTSYGSIMRYPSFFCRAALLEVSMYQEGPATGHLAKGFLSFPLP